MDLPTLNSLPAGLSEASATSWATFGGRNKHISALSLWSIRLRRWMDGLTQSVFCGERTNREVLLPRMEGNGRGTFFPTSPRHELRSSHLQRFSYPLTIYHTRNHSPTSYSTAYINMRSPIITFSLVAAAASSAMGSSRSPATNDAMAQPHKMDHAQTHSTGSAMGNTRRALPVPISDTGIPIAIGENNVGPHARRQLLGSLLGGAGQADAARAAVPTSKAKAAAPDSSKYDTISDDLMSGEEKNDLPPPHKATTQMAPPGSQPPATGGQQKQAAARPPATVTTSNKRSEKKVNNGEFANHARWLN
ncbi:hypothetical protein OBBRIDRAFT_14469 [Obba rivulosa]|uniref:Uncharacterized protein n=1 Tax=Obba rivulosa TaxID=1052685 RepID=A0A8E2DVU0_9APHY|nr:hypothetical protein OBBRIDRAFT_14469 [Obba rivulosa]